MVGLVQGAGVVVAVAAALIVYVDASRQGFERALGLAVGVGVCSAVGFLLPSYLFASAFAGLDQVPPARTVALGTVATGAVVTAAALFLYGLASRMPRPETEG